MRTDPDAQAMQEIMQEMIAAVEALLVWDKERKHPMPYRVRDPLRSALAHLYACTSEERATLRERLADSAGAKAVSSPHGWRFTGIAGFKKFVSDDWYQKARPEYRKWYEPICAKCPSVPTHTAAVQALQELVELKDIKDRLSEGHCVATPEERRRYNAAKPGAWERAKAAIRAMKTEDVREGT